MVILIGKVIDIFIPEQYKNDVLLDINDRTNIGFKVLIDGQIKEVIVGQDELLKILEQEFKTIKDINLRTYNTIQLCEKSFVLKIRKQHLFTMLMILKNKLPKSLEKILESLNVYYYQKEKDLNIQSWNKMYKYAKIYYEHYGNLEVLQKFKTNDGYTYDEEGSVNLGQWINRQRNILKPDDERYKKLLEIGMRFEKLDELNWNRMYEYAKIYYEHHGNLEVLQKFKTNDGYTYDEEGRVNLGQWILNQRRKLTPEDEKYKKLLEIGMCFKNIDELKWDRMYEYAKIYYEHHGNLEVLQKFKTNDGYTYDEEGNINLGRWIHTQRKSLSSEDERYKKLLKIGMNFYKKIRSTLTWEEMYEYAKIYYEHYGNLQIPQKFKTNDGYTYDEEGNINLGRWIHTQRKSLNSEDERYKKLLKIGMNFYKKIRSTLTWEEMYEYAKTYYEHHGNLEISINFKTNNGYTYDEEGSVNLGQWISNQRRRLKPEDERYETLSKIGMIWRIRKNKKMIDEICSQYGIDNNKNISILSHISIQELELKIRFLLDNNLPIINEQGILHEIFNMSSLDMKSKYGNTLEELIEQYYINNEKRM